MSGPAGVQQRLARAVDEVQAARRVPLVSAAVALPGVAVEAGAGVPAPGPDVQFRIGSITKTFTAALVLALRDAGRLDLDDPYDGHVPGVLPPDVSVRDLLAHRARLVREPAGPFWEAVPGPTGERLRASVAGADPRLPPVGPATGDWHYSNLGYALLGQLVEQLHGEDFATVLVGRITGPLGMTRTTWLPQEPYARGWRVHPYGLASRPEPLADTAAMGSAGQLWSTPRDLVRWGLLLARPDPAVLSPASVAEMTLPLSVTDPARWSGGYGLGLQLWRRGELVLVGHGGSMPGFVAGLAVAREAGVAVAACGNAWQSADLPGLCAELAAGLAAELPPPTTPWSADPPPPDVAPLLGAWWLRGSPFVVEWVDAGLRIRRDSDTAGVGAERFVRESADRWRGLDLGQAGEALRVVRDEAGGPTLLDVGGWLLSRSWDDPRSV